MLAERNGEREGTAQGGEDGLHSLCGRKPCLHLLTHQMGNDFSISLAFKRPPARDQAVPQRFEIFDDPVVDERDFARCVGMRVARRRRAVRCPAGMRDADIARRVIGFEFSNKVRKFALRAAANELAVINRADTCRIITAIFHPFQPINQSVRDCTFANNSNNSAHKLGFRINVIRDADARHLCREILCIACH